MAEKPTQIIPKEVKTGDIHSAEISTTSTHSSHDTKRKSDVAEYNAVLADFYPPLDAGIKNESPKSQLKKDIEVLPVLQYPEAGKRRKIEVDDEDDTEVMAIMPHVITGRIRTEFEDSATAAHIKVEEVVTGRVYLKVQGYTNYIKDFDYIRRRREVILGKISEWCKATLDLLDHVESDEVLGDIHSPGNYFRQRTWAEKIIPMVMLGISAFHTISVNVQNCDALITHVNGIDTLEEANFVYHISNCEHYLLCVKPMSTANDFTIETIFDHVIGKAYGKRANVARLLG
jgi:hypothetical protein